MTPYRRLLAALALMSVAAAPPAVVRDSYGDPLPPGAVARLGSSRLRHPNYNFTFVAISPDSSLVASVGFIPDTRIRVWDRKTGRLLREWDSGEQMSTGLHFTPDGKGLISCHYNLVRWDLATGERRPFLRGVSDAENVHFSPDGKTVVVRCTDNRGEAEPCLRVHDLATGKERFSVTNPDKSTANAACFTSAGEIAFGSKRGLHVWDITTNKELATMKLAFSPKAIAVSSDGKTFAAQGYDREVVIVHGRTKPVVVKTAVKGDNMATLAFSPDDREVWFAPRFGPLVAFDPKTGKQTRVIVPHDRRVSIWCFSDKRDYAVRFAARQFIAVYDLKTGARAPTFDDHRDGSFLDVAVSPDGKLVGTQSADALRVWTFPAGKLLRTIPGENFIPGVRWTARGDSIAVGTKSGKLHHYDPHTGKRLAEATVFRGTLLEASLLADGKRVQLLVLTKDGDHRPCVTTLAKQGKDADLQRYRTIISPEGNRAFAVADTKTDEIVGRVFQLGTNQTIWERPVGYFENVAFTPDGSRLIVLRNGKCRLLDAVTGTILRDRPGPALPIREGVELFTISPDGRCVVVGGQGIRTLERPGISAMYPHPATRLFVVELATGQVRRELAPQERVIRVAFSPDGRHLVSSATDGTALVWNLSQGGSPPVADAWNDLSAPGARGYAALCALIEQPHQTVRLLEKKLAVNPIDPKVVKRHLAALDHDSFDERRKAWAALAALHEDIEGTLRGALPGATIEARSSITRLLASIESDPQVWRRMRAVEVLERVATPEAVALLERLAGGFAGSASNQEASNALRRLRK